MCGCVLQDNSHHDGYLRMDFTDGFLFYLSYLYIFYFPAKGRRLVISRALTKLSHTPGNFNVH